LQWWWSDTGCSGVTTLATKRLRPEWHPQASRLLAQVYRKPGRLCLKIAISVSKNKSKFLFYLQIIIHICPTLVDWWLHVACYYPTTPTDYPSSTRGMSVGHTVAVNTDFCVYLWFLSISFVWIIWVRYATDNLSGHQLEFVS
jgi:hypothetical protein